MTRISALRLVFISAGLLICVFIFREAILAGLTPTYGYPGGTAYNIAEAILYDGWGIAALSAAGLYGLYRLIAIRVDKP